MKKIYLLSLLFIVLCTKIAAQVLQIGTSTASASVYSGPIYRYSATSSNNFSKYAYIYTSTELATIPPGSIITQIEWEKASGTITAPNNFEILLANNSATMLSTGTNWGDLTNGATSVYNSTNQAFTAAAPGWESFVLTTPFVYTGGTLQVLTDHQKLGTASGAVNFYRESATGMAIGWVSGSAGSATTSLSTTTYGNWRPNIKIHYVPSPPCSGIVFAGTANASVSSVCPSDPYSLSLSGNTLASGITYQWQFATSATGPFTDITGATNAGYQSTQTVDTWYQCIVTCTGSGSIDTTNVVSISTNSFLDCYCTSNATNTTYGDIQRVELNTINNSSTTCNGTYSDYTTTSTLLTPGATYLMELDLYNCTSGTYNYGTRVWIDLDHNGLFDTYEMLYDQSNSLPPLVTVNVPINLSIPATALSGLTRMRIVIVESNATPSPCGTYSWGETEDYMVNITPPPTCPPPTLLNVVSSTFTSGTIDWTAGGTETEWQVEYGTQGFALGTGTTTFTTIHPYLIDNLNSYAFYSARVRAVCSPGDSSYWTPLVSWNTYNQGQFIEWNSDCPTTGFVDISTTGTNAGLSDDTELGITLPFPVLYQGNLFTTITIGNNGGVEFGTTTANISFSMPNNVNGLYPYIQDLDDAFAPNGVFYEQIGASPNSKFIVQWENIAHFTNPPVSDGATFELIIDEATQEIYYVYDDVIMGNPTTWDYGADAEIGVRGPQNINVSINNQAYLQNNSCVHFYYVDCPNPDSLTTTYLFPNEGAFAWTASAAGETAWTVVYGPTGFDPLTAGTTVTVNAASVQLLNLIPLGNYDMYIYSDCAGGLQSNGLFFNFQTPPICSNPTALTSTAAVDSLMSSWSWSPVTSFYPSTGFNLHVVAQDSALYTGATYVLDNNFTDTTTNSAWYPGQEIDVYVQAVCGQDTSAFVGPISLIMPISNDNPCGAHEIIVGAPGLLYNNTGATVSSAEVAIAPPITGAQTTNGWANNNLNHTTWFKFKAPASGDVRINATGVEYNGQIAVYFGTDCSNLPSFSLEGANDDEIDGTSQAPNFTVCGLTPGVDYYMLHDGSVTPGTYKIEISEIIINAGVEGEALEICYGESVNLFLGISNYILGGEWSPVSPALVIQGNTFNSNNYASPQTYTFNYAVNDGCAVDQAMSTVIVYATPSAGEDGSIDVCLNEPFNLLAGLSGSVDLGGTWYNASNQALASYLDTAANIGGQFNYDYIVTSTVCPADTSTVLVIVDGSCDFTATIETLEVNFRVYPNPTNSVVFVDNEMGLNIDKIELIDMSGRVVLSVQKGSFNNELAELNVANLTTGVYTVKMTAGQSSFNQRLIKQ